MTRGPGGPIQCRDSESSAGDQREQGLRIARRYPKFDKKQSLENTSADGRRLRVTPKPWKVVVSSA